MLRQNRHSTFDLEYYLVVITKYRHPVIRDSLKSRLIEISYELLEEHWGCVINEINSDKDYLHILFEAPPQVQLSKLVNNFKTVSSRRIRNEFKEFLKDYYWKPYFWSRSYFIGSVSERSHKVVQEYIQHQTGWK